MTTTNQSLRLAAHRMLTRLGMDATITVTEETFDRAAGRAYGTSESQYAVKVSPPEPYIQTLAGERQVTEDLYTLVAALNLAHVPTNRDRITVAGKTYTIVGVEPIYGGNDAVAYGMRLAG